MGSVLSQRQIASESVRVVDGRWVLCTLIAKQIEPQIQYALSSKQKYYPAFKGPEIAELENKNDNKLQQSPLASTAVHT